MSSFTTQLRWYIESFSQDIPGITLDNKIANGIPHLFDFNYPIFNESYKQQFETDFIVHFYQEEIAFETIGIFKMRLRDKLNMIMPKYNIMWAAINEGNFDPLTSVNITDEDSRTRTEVAQGSDSSTSSSDGSNTSSNEIVNGGKDSTLRSDLPQANYAGVDYGTQLDETTFGRTESENGSLKSNSTTKTDGTTQNNVDVNETLKHSRIGNDGKTKIELFTQFMQEFKNVELQIFDECNDLFFNLYELPSGVSW